MGRLVLSVVTHLHDSGPVYDQKAAARAFATERTIRTTELGWGLIPLSRISTVVPPWALLGRSPHGGDATRPVDSRPDGPLR